MVPIGRPVARTRIHLLDEDGNPVAAGQAGRLFIGGVQVARGYLNRPELTAERFVPDRFSDDHGARLYDSGDLARELPDGAIEFLGRDDHQVKLHGFRVELGEVESALDSHPAVAQAVVVAGLDRAGDQRLVAYFVASTVAPSTPASEDLRAHLAATLPDHMVPALFVELDGFPISPSGKLDRAALPEPARPRPPSLGQPLRPRDDLERYIAAAWADVIGLAEVGRTDRFFELGGTSLQAARFTNRLQRDLGEPVFVVSLFNAPTVAEYAAFLRADYAGAVSRWSRITAPEAQGHFPRAREAGAQGEVTEAMVDEFLGVVPGLEGAPPPAEDRNPRAAFILAPPRSGTTLLRVMLAGHPDLFAASELQLLGFHTLRSRQEAYTGRFSLWLDGTVRTLMELEQIGPSEARALMDDAVEAGLTTQQFYRRLQQRATPRLLIDKSPSYASDPTALAKAEAGFDQPFYIHLVRHPVPVIRSFEKHHMDQALFVRDHDFDRRSLAELVWTASHRVVTRFLDGVPRERWHRIRYEDLVTEPRRELETLCERMGLPFHGRVLDPYEGLDAKMADGVFRESRPMGDTRFLEHGRVVAESAHAWRSEPVTGERPLGPPTRAVAALLGYGDDEPPDSSPPVPAGAEGRRASLAARRDRHVRGRARHG